jgi:hypothetical protein
VTVALQHPATNQSDRAVFGHHGSLPELVKHHEFLYIALNGNSRELAN